MEIRKKKKIIADIIILVCGAVLLACMYIRKVDGTLFMWAFVLLVLLMMIIMADIVFQSRHQVKKPVFEDLKSEMNIWQLILLDEQDKPIKSWDMSGKIAMVIGKRNADEEIDVDLEDCEYSSFIDPQHAALNFCRNSWYVEDMGSQNGVMIKKVEDGGRYKVLGRPCRVAPGDIIYIANTKLLLT